MMFTGGAQKHSKPSATTMMAVRDAAVTTLARASPITNELESARQFDLGHVWFSEVNRQEAMEHIRAAMIAYEHNLSYQIALHVQEAQTITARDVADRVQNVVAKRFGYRGPRHYYASHGSEPFVVREVDKDHTRYEWHYMRIEEFERLIPPRALAALAFLEKAGLSPQAYWVADKRRQATQTSVDPILAAQYGPWFVAVAEWI
jgi:hypothetical protein